MREKKDLDSKNEFSFIQVYPVIVRDKKDLDNNTKIFLILVM